MELAEKLLSSSGPSSRVHSHHNFSRKAECRDFGSSCTSVNTNIGKGPQAEQKKMIAEMKKGKSTPWLDRSHVTAMWLSQDKKAIALYSFSSSPPPPTFKKKNVCEFCQKTIFSYSVCCQLLPLVYFLPWLPPILLFVPLFLNATHPTHARLLLMPSLI